MMAVLFRSIFIYTYVPASMFTTIIFFCNISLTYVEEITISSIKYFVCLITHFPILFEHFTIHIFIRRLKNIGFLNLAFY